MKDILKKDITVKIGSVLIAVLFWLYVYNVSNPFTTKTFTNVNLKIENEDFLAENGYIIKNKYKTGIDITIRGRKEVVDKVKEDDFDAALDFSQIKSVDDNALTITGPFCNNKDIVIDSFSPQTIDVQLARTKNNTFKVELIPKITLKPGYKVLRTTVEPEKIPIISEEALIDKVASIKAVLEINDLDKDVTKKVECKVYNKDGKEIAALSKNLSVEVKVEVAKEIPVSVNVNGGAAENFEEVQRIVTPDKVLITGTQSVLSKINELQSEPVEINNIKENQTVTTSLKLPSGVKLADVPNEISVSFYVEQIETREFTIANSDISIGQPVYGSALTYQIRDEVYTIKLRGRTTLLNAITTTDLNPKVNVDGLAAGNHKIPLELTLPEGIKLLDDVSVNVKAG